MKKIAGKIAMILVLIMLANNFIGCVTIAHLLGAPYSKTFGEAILTDIIFTAVVLLVRLFISQGMSDAELPSEYGIYLASEENNQLTDYNSLIDKFNSLPENEMNSLIEKINSIPEAKRAFLFMTINNLSEVEITSSMERLNTLSETEFISAVQAFNSLSEAELDLVIDKLNKRVNSQSEINTVATVDCNPIYAHMALKLQY